MDAVVEIKKAYAEIVKGMDEDILSKEFKKNQVVSRFLANYLLKSFEGYGSHDIALKFLATPHGSRIYKGKAKDEKSYKFITEDNTITLEIIDEACKSTLPNGIKLLDRETVKPPFFETYEEFTFGRPKPQINSLEFEKEARQFIENYLIKELADLYISVKKGRILSGGYARNGIATRISDEHVGIEFVLTDIGCFQICIDPKTQKLLTKPVNYTRQAISAAKELAKEYHLFRLDSHGTFDDTSAKNLLPMSNCETVIFEARINSDNY